MAIPGRCYEIEQAAGGATIQPTIKSLFKQLKTLMAYVLYATQRAKPQRMKKVIVSSLVALLVIGALVSCKKVISKIFDGFDAEIPEILVTIPNPGIPAGFPVPQSEMAIGSFTQSFNLDSIIKANTAGAFGAGDVNSVKIKQMVFAIKNADANNNLSNFESARFEISSNTNTTPVGLASFNFPNTYAETQTYVAPSDAPELRNYLTGTQLTYHSYAKIRRYTTKAISLSIKVTITAK